MIGEGLEKLKFGMTRDDVKKIVGEPNDTDTFDYEDSDDKTEIWHFDEKEFSLGFDEDSEWQLMSIAISHPDAEIAGKKLIGMKIDDAKVEIGKMNLGELFIEEVEDEDDNEEKGIYKELFSEESNISFWFDENILTEIQWGPIFEE